MTDIADNRAAVKFMPRRAVPPPAAGTEKLANRIAAELRGERLFPARHSRLYWHLTCVRQRIEEVIARYMAPFCADHLVDYGCGTMPYRQLFQPYVKQYLGADLPGNMQADLTLDDPLAVPLADASTDVVLSSQVLEHVGRPAEYLREAHRLLRDGGLLILTTHGVWSYHPDPVDYWRWTSAGLRKIVAEAGFELVYFRGVMGPTSTALQLWQDAAGRHVRGFFRPTFYRIMQQMIRSADNRCSQEARDRDASNYVLVGRKLASAD